MGGSDPEQSIREGCLEERSLDTVSCGAERRKGTQAGDTV